MKKTLSVTLYSVFLLAACNPSDNSSEEKEEVNTASSARSKKQQVSASDGHYTGTFSNGMKGNKISFDVEGEEVKNLTFEGYWHCEGKLDLTTLGPEQGFPIKGSKVDGRIKEPEDGIAPFFFELHGTFDGDAAEGSLAIDNIAAGCTTYKLNWTAERE